MNIYKSIFILCLVSQALISAQELEHPFNIDVEILWAKRARSPSLDLVDYNGDFCQCGCGPNNFSSTMVINDLDRRVAARISLNVKKNLTNTLEFRGTTPLDFSYEKTFNAPSQTNVACDLAYGYFRVSPDQNPYTPIIDVQQKVIILPFLNNGVTVNHPIYYYDTDYIEADKAKIDFSNSYFNVESNYWFHLTPRWVKYFSVSYGFGLRYFSFMESFKERFYKIGNSSFFSSGTKNQLFGGQVLLDFHVHPYHWLDWGLRLDGGACASHLRLDFEINDYNSTVLLAKYSKQKIYYSFFGDLELFLAARFMERVYGLFSFGGTLIHGVAQAMPNIDITTSKFSLYTQGNVLYQFWSLGLGYDF